MSLISHTALAARCNITSNTTAGTNTCSSLTDGDTMYISATLTISADYTVLASADVVVIVDNDSIVFDGNFGFDIGSGGKLVLINGGKLANGIGSCNANRDFNVGNVKIASCNGGGANFSFDQVNTAGGFDSSSTLPVEMIYFRSERKNQSIHVSWATASELNNRAFELYHSHNGNQFRYIAEIPGHGTSVMINRYEHILNDIQPGPNFFKLIQWDFDGHSETFLLAHKSESPILGSPRLLHIDNDEIRIEVPEDYTGQVMVYDVLGNKVTETKIKQEVIRLSTVEWKPQLYLIMVNEHALRWLKP
ncbi:MAG: hypothetical protein JJ975_00650 [Bacteroidia bacterium]|nr:hypothetical protein [Bacteroidia bacterium]